MSGSVVTGEGGVWEDKTGPRRLEPYRGPRAQNITGKLAQAPSPAQRKLASDVVQACPVHLMYTCTGRCTGRWLCASLRKAGDGDVLCSRTPVRLEAPRPCLVLPDPPLARYNAPGHGTKNFKNPQLWLKNSWEYSQLQQLGIIPRAALSHSETRNPQP
jgi:hypothetical protein